MIVCGWGRVGRATARELADAGMAVVIVDTDAERVATIDREYAHIVGDASDDDVLRHAGIERAAALVAAVDTDAANLFITLSGRSLREDLFVVARAREESSVDKLLRAGADRVVNPQEIGGARIAAFVARPRVTEFLDVVMHSRETALLLEEVVLTTGSALHDQSLSAARVRDRTGALVLALHDPAKGLLSNPASDVLLQAGQTLIAVGTPAQLAKLEQLAGGPRRTRVRTRRRRRSATAAATGRSHTVTVGHDVSRTALSRRGVGVTADLGADLRDRW